MKVYQNITELIGRTPLLELKNYTAKEAYKARIFAKLEYFNPAGSVKDRIAYLLQQPHVTKVLYPGIPSHPGYEIITRQSRGYGAMISFEVDSAELAQALLEKIKLIQFAESLGGTETLMTYPITQTHADVPEEQRVENGITDCLLRLSVGIENGEDLLEDLKQAFDSCNAGLTIN